MCVQIHITPGVVGFAGSQGTRTDPSLAVGVAWIASCP
jgi:hypothetical protein